MSTITKEFTKEQLQQIIETDHVQCGEASALARIALASRELERGMIRRFDLDMSDCDSCGQDCGADMVEDLDGEYVLWDEVLPHLYRYDEYTAHPAPVSVPDDVMSALQKVARIRLDLNDFDGDRRGIAECLGEAEEALIEVVNRRAAMLQGADGNSPVIPDGWVMVPVEPTKEMIDAGWSYYMTTKSPSSLGVYGAMLAAAPRQEVK